MNADASSARYIVSSGVASDAPPLAACLASVPELRVLRLDAPRFAVVEATREVISELARRYPHLEIEPDVRHRPVRAGG
ncbi:hypothetical protein WMF30_51590 [Sorangium sp. So ce134]